jgi:hypothetical protein
MGKRKAAATSTIHDTMTLKVFMEFPKNHVELFLILLVAAWIGRNSK